MKHKNKQLTLFQRYSLMGLACLLLAHIFVVHNHLLTQNETQAQVQASCNCCPNSNESQIPPEDCGNCCHCDFDIKTHSGDFVFAPIFSDLTLAVPLFPLSIHAPWHDDHAWNLPDPAPLPNEQLFKILNSVRLRL